MYGNRVRPIIILCVAAALAMSRAAQADAQPTPAELGKANTLFLKRDWRGALAAYESLWAAFPQHALARFRMGTSMLELGMAAQAEPILRDGERLGVPVTQAAFRLGQALAEQGKSEAAVVELLRSAKAGMYLAPTVVDTNRHFVRVRHDPRWREVLDAFDVVVHPCNHDARYREFDFWVGDWNVRQTGQQLGPPSHNLVTKEDNGCVVMEHWDSPVGSTGKSFNLYDQTYGVWRQTWVDNGGAQHDYRGSLKDGNMVFVGDMPDPSGKSRVPVRLTFFHVGPDSVRQFSEITADSGRTWTTNYDFMYVRRRSPMK